MFPLEPLSPRLPVLTAEIIIKIINNYRFTIKMFVKMKNGNFSYQSYVLIINPTFY